MRSYQFRDPVFSTSFLFMVGSRALLNRQLHPDSQINEKCSGCTLQTSEGDIIIWLAEWKNTSFHISVLVHECYHAMSFALAQVAVGEEGSETRAYYLDWLVRILLTHLTRRK